MKQLLFFILVFAAIGSAQVFDEPIDSTDHYAFRLYAQSARVPFTILNEDKEKIDSLIFALIVYTDTSQYFLVTDTDIAPTGHFVFKTSNYATGTDAFVTTAVVDTFTVTGTDTLVSATDYFWIQAFGSAITSNDVLAYQIITSTNTVIVTRPASGTSGLNYVWRWIRRY